MKKISSLILAVLLFVSTVIANPKKEKCTYAYYVTAEVMKVIGEV